MEPYLQTSITSTGTTKLYLMKSRSFYLTLLKYHHVDITQESKMKIKSVLEVNAVKTVFHRDCLMYTHNVEVCS